MHAGRITSSAASTSNDGIIGNMSSNAKGMSGPGGQLDSAINGTLYLSRKAVELCSPLGQQVRPFIAAPVTLREQLAIRQIRAADVCGRRVRGHPSQVNLHLWSIVVVAGCENHTPQPRQLNGSSGSLPMASLESLHNRKPVRPVTRAKHGDAHCNIERPQLGAMDILYPPRRHAKSSRDNLPSLVESAKTPTSTANQPVRAIEH